MLNVLQLIPTLDRSGAEKQMALLAAGLPRDRFHVEVATLTRLGPLEADLNAAGLRVTNIGKRFKADPFALLRLARFIKRGSFDVVQTWIFAADTYGRMAAHWARVPVVVTSEMAVDLWKGRTQLAADRYLARWTDKVVGNSQAVVDFYRKAGIPEGRLSLIYSGIADEEPPSVDRDEIRRSLGLPEGCPLAIFVGRLAEQKGVDYLLAALDLLQHVQPDLRTIFAGDGPSRARLEAKAAAFELTGKGLVKFLGHRDDVPRLLAASDLLVLPSLYEGLPNVVLEAMRFAKPVVATAAPGTTELVVDGETGVLVPIGNGPLLARAIRDLVRDPERGRTLGKAGRQRVETEFGVARMIESYATLYEELAESKRSNRSRK